MLKNNGKGRFKSFIKGGKGLLSLNTKVEQQWKRQTRCWAVHYGENSVW